jgi:dTDP-4-amino-4,6-dideoxygalactose transaminase
MGIHVPFLDLQRQHAGIEAEIHAALARVISRGQFILGREVTSFEKDWARFCGVSGAVAVNSGTDALMLALRATIPDRNAHDEVITSPLSAGYTALAIKNAGFVPAFADIDAGTFTVAPEAIEKAITPHTRAIVPVHIYGQLAAMEAINKVAARHNLVVIEDAAQAHGASLKSRQPGTFSRAAAFSFYPTKNLGALGDAGAVVSNDETLLDQIRSLRQGGHVAAMHAQTAGLNSRLDELQAAVLRVKLRHLRRWNRARRAIAAKYRELLEGVADLKLPLAVAAEAHVFHLFVVQHRERDRLRSHLSSRGIETLIHYPFLLHRQKLFRRRQQPNLPVAESLGQKIVSLPLYPQLTDREIEAVVKAIRSF